MIGAAIAYDFKNWLNYRKDDVEVVEMRKSLPYNYLLRLTRLYLKTIMSVYFE
jgi:hypothetical protein